jgi:Tol biopolymer transport system component
MINVLKIRSNNFNEQPIGSLKKLFIGSFLILFAFYFSGCEICNGVENTGGDPSEEIYFTASPENSNYPNIYKTTPQGTTITNLVSNGISFSSPSNTGKITFIRKNTLDGSSNLFIADYNGANSRLLVSDNDIFTINYPVISPNGRYIGFNGGNSKLIYHDVNSGSVFNLITTRLAAGSIPSFSENSKYIAFVEGDGTSLGFTIKVIDAESSDIVKVVYSKSLGNINFSDNIEKNIRWSNDSKSIIFTVRNSNDDDVYLINIENSTERIVKIQNSTVGGNHSVLSPNNDYIAVSGTDGNIWVVFIATNDYKFSKITNSDGFERNFQPKWSTKGDKLLFNSSSPLDSEIYSTLICTEIQFSSVIASPVKSFILSNNVYRGFWNFNKEKI